MVGCVILSLREGPGSRPIGRYTIAGKAGSNALPPMLWPLPLFAPGALVPDHSWRNYAGRVFNELRCSSRLAGKAGSNALPPMLRPLPLFAPGALVPDHS